MKRNHTFLQSLALAASSFALLTTVTQAQTFNYTTGDLTLSFRQSGKRDVVVDIGPATTYENVSPGTTVPVTNAPALSVLLSTAYASLNGLHWSVVGAQRAAGDPNHPIQTIWATQPLSYNSPSLHSAAWTRRTTTSQGSSASFIAAIGGNAAIFSGANPLDATTNTATSIIIPNGSTYAYTPEISNPSDINASDLRGSFQGNVENITPADFTSAEPLSRSDLYQLVPSLSFATQGTPGKLLGHFDFTPDGAVTFTALAQPIVGVSPGNVTTTSNPGSQAIFAVTATGDGLSYQWSKDGTPLNDSVNIIGSQTTSLTVTNISSANVGSYSVVVTNDAGFATSTPAVLTVIDPPGISAGPSDVSATLPQGTNVNFSVGATGAQLAYQWSHNGSGLSGATDSSYTTTAQVANEGTYSVVVTNLAGSVSASAIFSSAIVTDTNKPTLTVTAPSTNVTHWTSAVYTLQGRATDNRTLASVSYTLNGGSSTAATIVNNTNWSAAITLAPGTNTIVVQSSDLAGNLSAAVTRTIAYFPQSGITLAVYGNGKLTTNWTGNSLDIGKAYTITAVPATGWAFSNWNGTVSSTNTKLVFALVSNETLTATFRDAAKPTVAITGPAADINRWTNNGTYALQGKASDNVAVTGVSYTVNGGVSTDASLVGTNWSATINLIPGTNTVVVQSRDGEGNSSAPATRKIVYVPQSPITLTIVGGGKLTTNWTGNNLDIGKAYTITAVPDTGNVFSNWTCSVSAITNKLVFVLQTNESLTATFIPSPFLAAAGAYNGLFYEASGVTHQSAGFFNIALSTNLTYSGSLKLAGKSIAISGKFNTDGSVNGVFARAGAASVSVHLQLDFPNQQIGGTISSSVASVPWTANLTGDRATFNASNNIVSTNIFGTSTLVIPGFEGGPTGYGYGTVNVASNGTITVAGATADASAIAQTVPVSKDGNWPFYASLYGGNGEVIGWLNFNATNNTPSGTISWIKTGWTNAILPGGFTNQAPIIASQYVKPTVDPILDFNYGFGQLTFTDANHSFASLNDVLVAYNSVVYTADATTKVSFTLGNGLFKGSFLNTYTSRTNSFTGVVLQQQNIAVGAFVEPAQTGSVLLQSGF